MAKTTKLVGYGIAFDMKLVGGAKTADDFKKAAKSVQKSLNASENAVKQYVLKQESLNQALKEGAITKKQYDQAMTTLAFREQKRLDRLERERRAVLGLDKQESILEKNRRNRARMAGMAASGVSGLGMGGRAAGAARFLGGAVGLGGPATAMGLGFAGLSLVKESVAAFTELEEKVVSLKTLFGESLGEQLTNQFRSLAKTTILTNSQLIENAKTWASYGLTTKGLTDRLKRLGTVAMGNSEKFRSLTIAFAQVNAQGKLMGQEKNQLINAGFGLQAVAEAAGISMNEFADAMKNGEITADHLNQALINVTSKGGRFFELLEKQAETVNGKMTILSSTWEEFLQTLGEAEKGPAGFFLDKMISAAETLKISAEYFAGKDIFPFSTTAGEAIPGSAALSAAGQQSQVDVGGLPKGFEFLDILSFMGINRQMFGLTSTSPYPTGEAIDAPSGFRSIPSIDPTIAKNVQEANDALGEQATTQEKLNNEFKRYMENVMLAESGRRQRTGSVAISQYEQQELMNEAKYISKRFGYDAYMTFKKTFPEVFSEEFSDKFVGPLEQSAFDRSRDEAQQNEARRRRMETLYNMEVENAEKKLQLEFDLLKEHFDERQKAVSEQLAIEKKFAGGPRDKDAYFTGGSVEEFMFLRRQAQVSEEAKATKEAEDRAQEQRRQINEERKQAEIEFRAIMAEFMGRESFVGPQPLAN